MKMKLTHGVDGYEMTLSVLHSAAHTDVGELAVSVAFENVGVFPFLKCGVDPGEKSNVCFLSRASSCQCHWDLSAHNLHLHFHFL